MVWAHFEIQVTPHPCFHMEKCNSDLRFLNLIERRFKNRIIIKLVVVNDSSDE